MIVLAIIGAVLGIWTAVAAAIGVIIGRAAAQAEQAEQPTVPDYVPAEWSQL